MPACPKPVPNVVGRHRKRVEADAALRDAYAEVDQRDAGICAVTGRYTSAGAVDPRVRREHHHLVPRSRDKALVADAANIVTCCAEAHALITAGWLIVEGTDARKVLRFHWRPGIEAAQRPFVIKSRRLSQERD